MLYLCRMQELLPICTSSWLPAAAPYQLGRLHPPLPCPMARAKGEQEVRQPLGNGFSMDVGNVGTLGLQTCVP